jgi:hypothetical protein
VSSGGIMIECGTNQPIEKVLAASGGGQNNNEVWLKKDKKREKHDATQQYELTTTPNMIFRYVSSHSWS